MRPLIIALLAPLFAAAQPFDLAHPDRRHALPAELVEVSALTDVDARTVACLHDEAATVYLIDLATGAIAGRRAFGEPGDMEGLTRVGGEYYALRSDGLIYRMAMGHLAMTVLDTFRVQLPQPNLEGLGYDERKGLILISPKGVEKGGPEARDRRAIHAYDPVAQRLLEQPVLELSLERIAEQARAKGFAVPERVTPKGRTVPALKLRFSSVAVDPVSDHYYLLSAIDRTLLVVDRAGAVVALHVLDAALFPKPEGITFLPGGALLISNEGKDQRPNLLRFERIG
ncbi:MAG: hypothetical protein QY325_07805 [Flavobacteriales bacterium]|nr:MAG: hypothetical protein QY325_07805 [Flavobacteriales bacterium]